MKKRGKMSFVELKTVVVQKAKTCGRRITPLVKMLCRHLATVFGVLAALVIFLALQLFRGIRWLVTKFSRLSFRNKMIAGGAFAFFAVILLVVATNSKAVDKEDVDTATEVCAAGSGNPSAPYYGSLDSQQKGSVGALSQYSGLAANIGAQPTPNIGIAMNGGLAEYPVRTVDGNNGISNQYRGIGSAYPSYYNQNIETAYNIYGSHFGGWKPDFSVKIQTSEEWEAYLKAFREQENRRRMVREMGHLQSQIRSMRHEGEMEARGWDARVRDDMKQLHEIRLDEITDTTKAERDTAADNNLERVYPGGWSPMYGGPRGDPSLYRDRDTEKLYRVESDGSLWKPDALGYWHKEN